MIKALIFAMALLSVSLLVWLLFSLIYSTKLLEEMEDEECEK